VERIPLGSEQTYVIFDSGVSEQLASLSASDQQVILSKLYNVVSADVSPDAFVYEQIRNIDIYRFSDSGRLYTAVMTQIPVSNPGYHIIYVLYVDSNHEYDHADLVEYSQLAACKVDRITSMSNIKEVEAFLDNRHSLDETDLADLIDR
jgi:hypothetical protein